MTRKQFSRKYGFILQPDVALCRFNYAQKDSRHEFLRLFICWPLSNTKDIVWRLLALLIFALPQGIMLQLTHGKPVFLVKARLQFLCYIKQSICCNCLDYNKVGRIKTIFCHLQLGIFYKTNHRLIYRISIKEILSVKFNLKIKRLAL